MKFPFAYFTEKQNTCLITDCFWHMTSTRMMCADVPLFSTSFICAARLLCWGYSAGFYFGCKVKHLLSLLSVHREHSAGYYCTCVLCKCMPDGHCCCCCCWMHRESSSLGAKGEKKKEEALWFPPSVLLLWSSVVNKLSTEMWAVINQEAVIVFCYY